MRRKPQTGNVYFVDDIRPTPGFVGTILWVGNHYVLLYCPTEVCSYQWRTKQLMQSYYAIDL